MSTSAADASAPDIETLRSNPLFSTLSDGQLRTIGDLLDHREFEAGATIFNAGDPGDSCYIVIRGQVRIFHDDGRAQTSRELARLGPAAVLGEGCLLTEQPRAATARAVDHVVALRLFRCDFDTMLEEDDVAAYRMVMAMAVELHRRLITSNRLLSEALRSSEATAAGRQWSLPA